MKLIPLLPKTRSALLEAMSEGHVSLEGETLPLHEPFIVIATQNPIEYEGTFPLPEAQLDRFLPSMASATQPRGRGRDPAAAALDDSMTIDLQAVTDASGLQEMRGGGRRSLPGA